MSITINLKTNENDVLIKNIDFKNKTVLEIGCGNGRITQKYASFCKQVYAFDSDPKQLKEVEKLDLKNVKFFSDDANKTKFPPNSFDIILYSMSLHHIDSKTALEKAYSSLVENGQIVVIEPTLSGTITNVFFLLEDERRILFETQKNLQNQSRFKLKTQKFYNNVWVFNNFKHLVEFLKSDFDPKAVEENLQTIKTLLKIENEFDKINTFDTISLQIFDKIE